MGQTAVGQTGVLNPNDPIVVYDPAHPPATPPYNTLVKWVKTDRLGWNTSSFKAYFYNLLSFRLKYPKSYVPGDGKKYPLYVFFHGVGERGSFYDNEFQLFHGGQTHSNAVDNGNFDGFLLYPQSSSASGGWSVGQIDNVAQMIQNYLIPQAQVDPNRIMINGLSGGGGATWIFLRRHPDLVAADLPMSGTAISDVNDVAALVWNPFWIANGGLDNAPAPGTVTAVINEAKNQGANYRQTFYPNIGHGVWNNFWAEPDYFPYLRNAHKANPWVRYGRSEFCPGDPINVTLGVTAGFTGYQWRKNGTLLANTANTLQVTDTGTYDCRILRGSEWSVWSPIPTKIKYKLATVSPDIQVSGLASRVLPAPDGKTTVDLAVPEGYTSYVWQKLNPTVTLPSTTNKLTGVGVGSYQVKVTEQFGCSSSFSSAFNVIDANGVNAPPPASDLLATTLSQTLIRLKWTLAPAPPNVETNFEVYSALAAAGPYTLIGFTGSRVDSFRVADLNPNTRYFFKVRAVNNTAGSAATAVSSALTLSDNSAPTPPANLHTGQITQSSVELIWEPSTDNSAIKNYDVYVNGNLAYTIDGDLINFTVYNLVNGQFNRFTIKARDLAGNVSSPSNQVVAAGAFSGLNYKHYIFTGNWSNLPDFNQLEPEVTGNVPNVTITNRLQDDNFAYLWEGFIQIPVTGSYTFRTSSDDGSKLYLGNLNGTSSPYSFGAAALVNNDGLHGTVNADGTRTLTAGTYPIAMTFFEQGGGEVMNVSWRTPQSGGAFIAIPNSAFVQNLPPAGATPTAPSALVATTTSAKKIALTWQDNSSDETGFELYRSTSSSGPFNIIATRPANSTSYSDSSLTASTTYYYRVKAINKNGGSAFDKVGPGVDYSYYELDNLSVLPNFTSTPKKTGRTATFDISPMDRADNFQFKFSSYIRITTAGTYTFYTSSDDGSKLYLNAFNEANRIVDNDGLHGTQERSGTKTLAPGLYPIYATFFERDGGEVMTVSYSGPGVAKTIIPASVLGDALVNATTQALPALPAAPTSLNGTVVSANKISLTWTNNALPANVVRYEVWHSQNTNANYELAANLANNAVSYVDSNLAASSTYFYKVLAVNEAGNSDYSNEINLTTSTLPVTVVNLAAIANRNITNDSTDVVNLTATTDLGSTITFTSPNLPAFATITSTGNTTGTLTLSPNSTQLGTFTITVTATDNFGGIQSKNFTVTVAGKNQVTVNLNFNQTLPQALPWNNMNAAPTNGATVNGLKDLNGNTTSMGVSLLTTFTGTYANAVTTGNNSGVFPDNVMKTMYFGSALSPYQFKLTGLSSTKKYSLIIHAGYPWTAAQQQTSGTLIGNYTVGGQTLSLNAANNTSQTIRFNGISPDATGNIVVTLQKPAGSGYVIINAMQIMSYDDSQAAVTLNAPFNASASGISTSKIKVSWQAPSETRTGFQVWRSSSRNGTYSLLGTVGGSVFTYTDSTLAANSVFFYKIRAVNNALFSAYSNIAGGSTVTYAINLNLNSQASLSAPAPWNNLNTLTFSGYTFPNMINTLSQPTGIDFNVIKNFTSFNDGVGITTGNNSGVVPDNVMKSLYYMTLGDTSYLTISGLNRTHVYNVEFFGGSTFNYAQTSVYKIGDQSVSLNTLNNTTNTVAINGIKPDSSGTVYITFYSTTPYGMLNSISIYGMPSAEFVDSESSQGSRSSGQNVDASRGANGSNVVSTEAKSPVAELALDARAHPNLSAFPNPFVDRITLSYDFKQNVPKFTVQIYGLGGSVIYRREFSNISKGPWQQTIQLDKYLSPGMYLIQADGIPGEKAKVFKLMKEQRR